jgi:AcrR family transcriptional regulator
MNHSTSTTKSTSRQEQIAEAALSVIARQGLNYLNIGTLATEVGVVPSAIYRHFPSKDEILKSVLKVIARRLKENVIAVFQATADPLEQLRLLLQRHVHLANSNAGLPRILFSEQIFAGDPVRRQMVNQTFHDYLKKIAAIIRAGQRQGHILPSVPADVAAVMFLGMIQPAVILQLMSRGTFDATRHAEQAWKLFRSMLQVPGS